MKKIINIIFSLLLVFSVFLCPFKTALANSNDDSQISHDLLNSFYTINDSRLLDYLEDIVYADLVDKLDSNQYFVENVSAIYISNEYLEELEYNSQSNLFFGFTLAELDKQFAGTKYVFTLDNGGQTEVIKLESIEYVSPYGEMLKNVAIGSGVILLAVTVSSLTAGSAPAISIIFAASAKTGTIVALSSTVYSGVTSAIIKGIETNNIDQALEAGSLSASEGFKWGAITGVLVGVTKEALALKGLTLNGLTLNEAAKIQQESKYPVEIIKEFKSFKEYDLYKTAGLKPQIVNGKTALIRNIDLNYKSKLGEITISNLDRMKLGFGAIDPLTGKTYQLHHINQNINGNLAILSTTEHQLNSVILNSAGKEGVHSILSDSTWASQRQSFWKDLARIIESGLLYE